MMNGTNIKQLENELKRHREINRCMSDWVWEVDSQGRFTYVDGNIKDILGYEAEELIGKTPFDFMPEEEAARVGIVFQGLVADKAPIIDLENWNNKKDGTRICLLTNGVPILDERNKLAGYRGIDKDITEKKKSREAIIRHKKIVDSVTEAIVVTDLNGVILDVNPAYEAITGYPKDEITGESPSKLKSDRHDDSFYENMWCEITTNGSWMGEIWDRRKSGEIFPKWLSINTFFDDHGQPLGYVGVFSDISENKRREEKLLNLAYYDPLTSIPNRSYFKERLVQSLSDVQQHGKQLALYYIDLDNFKYVNDTFGHNAGDKLLVDVAAKLQETLRDEDMLARLGGDEFALIHIDSDIHEAIDTVANRIISTLSEPFNITGHEIRVRASIGVSVFPDDSRDADQLIQNADVAMYDAKRKGSSGYQIFTNELHERNGWRLLMENKMVYAIERDEFDIYYQPQFDIANNRLVGSEALIRWNDPEGGLLSPEDFIPVAEESGLIIDIGQWVFRRVCAQLRDCIDSGVTPLRVAVNLSAEQFDDSTLVMVIQDALEQYNVPVDLIELEITESTLMKDSEHAAQILQELSAFGLHISIDDFGTGYSSLAYLKKFPVDKLKIDRLFISELPDNEDDALLTETMINLARNLGIDVLAEGAETKEQIEFLRQKNCQYAQGYYYSKPLPFNEFLAFIEQHEIKSLEH